MRPLIHIGYQKTGTTWLQRFLFPEQAAAGFASVPKKVVRRQFIIAHPLEFDAAQARRKLGEAIEKAGAGGALPVVTTERLSGSPHSGRHDVKDIAERLAATVPEARILAVVREQRAMIGSCYRQYVSVGGSLGPERYLQPTEGGATRMPAFELETFAYHRLLDLYRDLFDRRVLVLPFELLITDARRFVGRIADFAEAPVDEATLDGLPYGRARNVGPDNSQLAVRRILNKLGADDRVNPAPLFPGPRAERVVRRASRRLGSALPESVGRRFQRRLDEAVAQVVGDRFRESNRALSQSAGLDLGEFGYDV